MTHFTHHFFTNNRTQLLKKLQHGSLIFMAGNGLMQRTNDCAYKFDQESNFWYLSGIDHPDWWLIFDGISGKSWLIHPDIDDVRNIFDGSLDATKAQGISGVDAVIDRTEFRQLLTKLRSKHTVIYTNIPAIDQSSAGFYANPAIKEAHKELKQYQVSNCSRELMSLRAIKQDGELSALKQAIAITAAGYSAVAQSLASFKYEYEVEALLSYHFRKQGADSHAYEPIVAADANACTLHYIDNNDQFKKQSTVLIDAAARYEHLCADVTRTYSLSKSPSKRKQQLYNAVLDIQERAIKLCIPGESIIEFSSSVDRMMAQALFELKLIESSSDIDGLRRYFPHAIGHGLGIDVHDHLAGSTFTPGMVLTVEPGVYIPEERIGIRIEDDILISDNGHNNLTKMIAKDFVVK